MGDNLLMFLTPISYYFFANTIFKMCGISIPLHLPGNLRKFLFTIHHESIAWQFLCLFAVLRRFVRQVIRVC